MGARKNLLTHRRTLNKSGGENSIETPLSFVPCLGIYLHLNLLSIDIAVIVKM